MAYGLEKPGERYNTCGSKKIWDIDSVAGPTEARYVYIGSFAKTCIEYAEKFYPSSYVILSAKYGFLFPDDIIADYLIAIHSLLRAFWRCFCKCRRSEKAG